MGGTSSPFQCSHFANCCSVFGGLFRMSSIPTRTGVFLPGLPTYTWARKRGFEYFTYTFVRHLALEQFAERVQHDYTTFITSRTGVDAQTNYSLRFQLVWYAIVKPSDFELKRNSGSLYRSSEERRLQKQSYLVSHSMARSRVKG